MRSIRGVGIVSLAWLGLAGCLAGPHYEGPVTDHFDGERFHNLEAEESPGFVDFVRWRLTRELGPWRERYEAAPGAPPPERVDGGALRVTFVNHATTLVQMDGLNLLTDPIYAERASPFGWVGPERVRPPGIRFDDLPPIDVVVVSHNHYDHLDLETLRRLAARDAPTILVGLGVDRLLAEEGISGAVPLDWWQEQPIGEGTRVTCVPVHHFSARGLTDRNATLWSGWAWSGASGTVYFAGDTGWGPHFAQARERLGPIRLALLPVGAYRPRWFMRVMHISPREAIEAHLALEAGTSVPIHWGTFPLGDDGEREPVEVLTEALAEAGIDPARFPVLDLGEALDVP